MLRLVLVCLLVGITGNSVLGARILAVLPIPFRSHHIMSQAVLQTLADRGHQIVNYSPFPLDKPVANYTDVLLDTMPIISNYMTIQKLERLLNAPSVGYSLQIWKYVAELVQLAFKSNKLIELLQSNEKFDLFVTEALFAQEVFLYLGHKFNAPVVCVLPLKSFPILNKASGNSLSLSINPDFALPYTDHMTFYERLLNFFSTFGSLYYYYTQYLPSQEILMRGIYNDSTMPPLVDMVHNISLFVNNAHPTIHYAQPYSPNLIPIGGIHMAKDSKPLPQDLKIFLDGAKFGAIYLSLGSLVPDRDMPQQFYDNFLSVFRRLPQRVVWKTGAELSDLPDNVMTVKWAPQQDILAHPNVALFITHGGHFSMYETINAVVPTVCIPFYGDQRMNCKIYEEEMVGTVLQFKSLSESTIYSSVTKVLSDPRYKDNMRRLSAIYKDRPMSPADSLVFWVEYVLRHRGAHHLRPTSSAMSWYQLALLDVIVVNVIIICITFVLLYAIIVRIFALACSKKRMYYNNLPVKKQK